MTISKTSKLFIHEVIVTFQLVFIGTGSIVASEIYPQNIGDFGIGICFGLAVFLGILFFGRISNAHMNPAATLFSFMNQGINKAQTIVLLAAQVFGGLFASYFISLLAPINSNLGSTFPKAGLLNSWFIEFGLTFILICGVWFVRNYSVIKVAFVLGAIVFLEAWLGGPFTGASMNPIRSIVPAIFSGKLEYIWLYISAPLAATLAVFLLIKKGKLNYISSTKSRSQTV